MPPEVRFNTMHIKISMKFLAEIEKHILICERMKLDISLTPYSEKNLQHGLKTLM